MLWLVSRSRIGIGTHGFADLTIDPWIVPSICRLPSGNGLSGPGRYQSLRPRVFWKPTVLRRRGSTAMKKVLLCTM